MPRLVLGPLLRHVGERDATVWVETDAPCEVEVLGCATRTFGVAGHHYALVHVEGLEPGEVREYDVTLDGERAWPQDGSEYPPSVIRTVKKDAPLEIAFGSCRVAAPHEPPYTLSKDEDPRGREIDALVALVQALRAGPPDGLPHLLVLLGDQVYADECSPGVREFIRSRRDPDEPPGEQVADFEEYTRLYGETWGDPPLRWLLSTVPSAMIFDDHDVHDDWNTSREWVEEMRAKPWWEDRIVGAFSSYWIYQHIGNLSPADLATDELYARVREAGEDAAELLREFARRADRETAGTRWSYHRDLDGTRLVMMDSRAGRVLRDGRRCMVDDDEWAWIEEHASGGVDHLFLGTSLPWLLAPGMHHLEAWNEAVCDGVWGRLGARAGESVRQTLDLEHWAAFGESFERVCGLVEAVGSGRRGPPPASIVALSGDVHHAYLAEVAFRSGSGVRSAVYQAVCSPFRNPLDEKERRAVRVGCSRTGLAVGRALSRLAGVSSPPIRWRFTEGPVFDNQVATIRIEGRRADLRIEKAVPDGGRASRLETTVERRLA
ncbi:MAG: alkaline phosphatase D family protein [Thermoleophilaceae bacterium]